jgi:hypothetical protein
MLRQFLASATLLVCTACASTGQTAGAGPPGAGPADDKMQAEGERLIAQPPRGWRQTGATNIGNLRRAEFMPEGDSGEDSTQGWTRMIAFESIKEDPLPDPIEFVELMTSDRDYACGTFAAHPTFAGEENGYPTAVYLLVCHRDRTTERSEVTMMKTIRGNDYFYVISRSMRGDPIPKDGEPAIDKAEIGGWALFLKSVSVCDIRRPQTHPCPEAG